MVRSDLGKGVPDFWRRKDRVAVLLPLDTPLYDTANKAKLLQVKFFDTRNLVEHLINDLESFAPTILIAPPRVLRRNLDMGVAVSPRVVFSAAEKLEVFDRTLIEAGYQTMLREIYLATEGLLAVSCKHGRLHLSEDCMHFELQDVGGGLASPIISDFSRIIQITMRYKMNDLLRMDHSLCPCGSPLRVVSEIIGRMDDIFILKDTNARSVEFTQDVIRNTVVDCDRRIQDFRVIQTNQNQVDLGLDRNCQIEIGKKACEHLTSLFERQGCKPEISIEFTNLAKFSSAKLRRVESRVK